MHRIKLIFNVILVSPMSCPRQFFTWFCVVDIQKNYSCCSRSQYLAVLVSSNSVGCFCFLNGYSFSSSDLRKNLETLEKNGVNSLKTMVNLGSEVYMQAEVYVTYSFGSFILS